MAENKRPNILVLMTDQQQACTVEPGCPCRTPNIDRISARGVRFTRAHTVNAICSPARASLYTGLLPHTHGMVDCTHTVEDYRARFKADLPTWSRELQKTGYRTAHFGKWHVERSNKLEDFGYDEYEHSRSSKFVAYRAQMGLPPRTESFELEYIIRQPGYRDMRLYGTHCEPEEASAPYYLYSRGIDFIRRCARDPDTPWCLFVSTSEPHDPYWTPTKYYVYDPASIPQPPSFYDDLHDKPRYFQRLRGVWRDMTWENYAQATACYYASISLIDAQVGRLLDAMEASGQAGNTVVVYTTDHGDQMGAHGLLMKGPPPYEETYRVPLIVRWPGVVQPGITSDALVNLMDLAPTILEMTGCDPFPECQARSLVPLLRGEPAGEGFDQDFAEFHGQRFFYTQRILWWRQFKYVLNGFDYDELYDLKADPYEMNNLATDPTYADLLQEMALRMWKRIRETGDFNMYSTNYGMFRYAPVGPEAAR